MDCSVRLERVFGRMMDARLGLVRTDDERRTDAEHGARFLPTISGPPKNFGDPKTRTS